MELKAFLEEQKGKCGKRIDEIDKELDDLAKKNEETEDEAELKDIGDSIAELQAEKAEAEAELKEIEAQIDALKGEGEGDPAPEEGDPAPNPQRQAFLNVQTNFQTRKIKEGGQTNMTIEERKAIAEEFRKTGKMHIEKPQLRAVTIASGQVLVPTEAHGIENPADVPYSTILDFVKVEDMTGAGYNAVSLLEDYAEAGEYAEGATIDEDNPDFGIVTIQPEKGFKVLSSISNETLKTSPLNYYGKVEYSAMVALRRKIAKLIVTKAVGAKDDANNPVNASLSLSALDEKFLRSVCFAFGGDEGIFGTASLVLNKKDLSKLGELMSSYTKDYVFEIEPNEANPNIGVIKKGGLSVRYIINNNLPAFSDEETEEGATCMLYGDLKSIEVDLFGAYDIKVSEDADFKKDLLAIRGTAQLGVGVTRLHGLIEVKKPVSAQSNG